MYNANLDKKIPLLNLQGLRKSFEQYLVHRNVTFQVYRGEILGLMGSSGTGKSLLLKSIIGLEKPDDGKILFEGRDLTALTEHDLFEVRKRIGYVFQGGALFDSLSVSENLAYPLEKHTEKTPKEIQKIILERLAIFGLESSAHLYPSELSGGMQKRVGLLRATILDPELVLFDEPAAGLDPVNIRRLVRNIRLIRSRRSMTGIFVSHDFHIISAICDRLAILKDGSIYSVTSIPETRSSQDPVILDFTDTNYGKQNL
jgi:phospholipid/cholesterol/gamma-HCH transport system ATP-binding protein